AGQAELRHRPSDGGRASPVHLSNQDGPPDRARHRCVRGTGLGDFPYEPAEGRPQPAERIEHIRVAAILAPASVDHALVSAHERSPRERKEGRRKPALSLTKSGSFSSAHIIPPISGMPAPAPAGVFSGASATIASVVRMFFAIDAAFCSAERTTIVGSVIPALTRSSYSPVSTFRPSPAFDWR